MFVFMCDRCGKRQTTKVITEEMNRICPQCGDIMSAFTLEEIERLEKAAEIRLSNLESRYRQGDRKWAK